jgi:ABC-type uncharacterized transport system involved in gliding motility auxiliary subunit
MRAIGWILGIIGLMALIASGVGYAVFKPEDFGWQAWTGLAGLGLVGAWFAIYWKSLRALSDEAATGRVAIAIFASLLTGGIVVLANTAAHRYEKRWDMTKDQRYSLSQQSIDIASKLDREVEVLAFFSAGTPEESNFKNLLDGYTEHSTLLKVSFHDPYGDPLLAEQMKILTDRGTVVLKAGEQTQRLETNFGEEAFTNALVRVVSDKFHQVCSVTGHDEMDVADEQSESGLGFAKIKLEGMNYRVSTVNLLQKQPTPEDCEIVLLASPKSELASMERDRLARYVAAGGGLIVLVDPLQANETAADLSRYGVKVGDDVVVEGDPNRQFQGGQPTMILLDPSSYEASPITEKLKGLSLLFLARSVGKGADIAGLDVQVLAHGTDQSWGETTIDANIPAEPNPDKDLVGKVPVMVSVEVSDPAAIRTTTTADVTAPAVPGLALAAPKDDVPAPPAKAGGKVVVFGDGDFAGNQWFTKLTNQDLFLNAVAWMAGEKDQLSIRANDAAKGKLELSTLDLVLVILGSMLVVPGIAIMGMVGTWMARRGR